MMAREVVVFVNLTRGVGGPARSIGGVMAALDDDVHRLLLAPRGAMADLARRYGWCDSYIRIPRGNRLRYLFRVVAAVQGAAVIVSKRRRLLAVHANGEAEIPLVALGVLLARVPLVVSARAYEVKPWTRRLAPLWRRMLPRMHWVPVSHHARDMVIGAGLIPPERVSVIPNPVNTKEVAGDPAEREERPADAPVRIGYLGGKDPEKGFLLLPDVIEALLDESVEWLLFVGARAEGSSPEQRTALERLRAAPQRRVSLRAKEPDVRRAYGACDIVFAPSLKESFGRIVPEAMANGLPVVATDLPPFRDVLGDDEAGIVVPAGDVQAAADALRRLVKDPELRRRLGKAGLERVGRFAPETIAQRFLALYRQG